MGGGCGEREGKWDGILRWDESELDAVGLCLRGTSMLAWGVVGVYLHVTAILLRDVKCSRTTCSADIWSVAHLQQLHQQRHNYIQKRSGAAVRRRKYQFHCATAQQM